jgi:hypothetical protein
VLSQVAGEDLNFGLTISKGFLVLGVWTLGETASCDGENVVAVYGLNFFGWFNRPESGISGQNCKSSSKSKDLDK